MSVNDVKLDLNSLARRLKSLHVPGTPVLLANVHDASSAQSVASQSLCKAIATASFAIAASQGVHDDDMTLLQNLQGIRNVAQGLKNSGRQHEIPLSADLQDGYEDPAESIQQVLALGVVGCNIEDLDNRAKPSPTLRSLEDATARVRAMVEAAKSAGVPDFVVNARTDVFGFGGTVDDVVARGKAFLAAGATTVFVWGVRKKVITPTEVKEMVERLDGRLAVQPGGIPMRDLQVLGVSRISVGPLLYRKSMEAFTDDAELVLTAQI